MLDSFSSIPLYVKQEAIEYIEAIGLAVRGLEDGWSKTDPFFEVIKSDKKSIFFKDISLRKV